MLQILLPKTILFISLNYLKLNISSPKHCSSNICNTFEIDCLVDIISSMLYSYTLLYHFYSEK